MSGGRPASILGDGVYATVYVDESDPSRATAVKMIHHNNFWSAIREIALLHACAHPNVISLREIEYTETHTIIRMPRYPTNLDQYVKEFTLLSLSEVYSISLDLFAGLRHIHARGLIHGDLKSRNVLIEKGVSGVSAVICDMGLGTLQENEYRDPTFQTSTYRAPEVDPTRSHGRYSEKVDVFSLGCILYFLGCGKYFLTYDASLDDSVVYLTRALGLVVEGTRKQMRRRLNSLRSDYIIHQLYQKMKPNIPPDRLRAMLSSGFIKLLAFCVRPCRHNRLCAERAYEILCEMNGRPYAPDGHTKIRIDQFPMDEIECIQNQPPEILGLSEKTLCLAERIYRAYMAARSTSRTPESARSRPKPTDESGYKLGCLYLSTCILEVSHQIFTELSIPFNTIASYSAKVMLALHGRLL